MMSLALVPSFSKPQDHHLQDDKSTNMAKNKEHEMKEDGPKDHQREKRTLSFLPDAEDAADFMDEIPGGEMGKKMLKALMKGGVPPQPVLVGFVEQPVPVQVAVPYPAPPPQPYYPPQ